VLDADTYRADLELRLISLSLKDRLIDLTACVATLATSDACHRLMQRAFGTFETCRPPLTMSVHRGDRKWPEYSQNDAIDRCCRKSQFFDLAAFFAG
jgi:hypothetical protein